MDPKRLEAEIASCRERAIAVAANILGQEDAEDAVQEASLRAWRYSSSFNPSKSTFWAWYSRIVVNCSFVILKRAAPHKAVVPLDSCGDVHHADPESSPENLALRSLARDTSHAAVHDALRTLHAENRALVSGYYLEGRDIEDVARQCGVDVGSARMRLSRSMRIIRARLAETLSK